MFQRKIKNNKVILIAAIVAVAILVINLSPKVSVNQEEAQAADWYGSDWSYRTQITIDHTKVPSNQAGFPVLVSSTSNDWKSVANGGHVEQSLGQDFVFVGPDHITKLPHEIEKYDATTGELIAWVKSDLSSSADSSIFLYFGNSSCADQQSKTDVWTSGYSGVWHLAEPSGNFNDSTSNGKTAEDHVTAVGKTGKLGLGQEFNGTTDYANIIGGGIAGGTIHTAEAWVYVGDTIDESLYAAVGGDRGESSQIWAYDRGDAYWMGYISEGSGSSLSYGHLAHQWLHLTSVRNGLNVKFYVNGVQTADANLGSDIAEPMIFIGKNGYNHFWKGNLDEIRFSTITRTADWILTEYNNQSNASQFYSMSATEMGDKIAPSNPNTIHGYDAANKTTEILTETWYNHNAPYFEFAGASDDSSGIGGYYLYFGSDADATPSSEGALQNHIGELSTHQNYSVESGLSTGQTYYLRVQTKDLNNNLSAAETLFVYKFDSLPPSPPEYVNVSPVGCSTSTSYTFTWPEVMDNSGSEFRNYQYKKGTGGTVNDFSETSLSTTSYQEGDNILYVRAVDNAGNFSTWQSAVFCSTGTVQMIDGPVVTSGPSSISVNWVTSKATTSSVKVYEGNTYVSEQGQMSYDYSHSIKVIGLEPEKRYRYQLLWTDQAGNLGESDWYETNTEKAPQINNLKTEIISPTSLNVSWNSTVDARFSIEYGLADYSSRIPLEALSTGSSNKIDGLIAGSRYMLRVNATTADGTKFFAGLSCDMPPLPGASSITYQPIADMPESAFKIVWKTNVETSSSLFYGPAGEAKSELSTSSFTKDHEMSIEKMADNSEYEIQVGGIDQFGNSFRSQSIILNTAFDTRPPKISGIVIESSNVGLDKQDKAQIAVSWKTDEPSTSQVEYGEGISGGTYTNKTIEDKTMTKNHLVIISSLTPTKPYHIRIVTSDKGGNETLSDDHTVMPGNVPMSALQIILQTFNRLFGWMKF